MPTLYQYREFGRFRLFLAICVVVQHAVMASSGLMRLVDPGVNRLRDLIRGKRLQAPERGFAISSRVEVRP
jgi:hypothetical protein